MTNTMIDRLVEMGAHRWTKGGKDRLYMDAAMLGLSGTRYKTGNVRCADFNGERISNFLASRLLLVDTYVDLYTGKIHSGSELLRESAEALIASIEADMIENTTEEDLLPDEFVSGCEYYRGILIDLECLRSNSDPHELRDGWVFDYRCGFDRYLDPRFPLGLCLNHPHVTNDPLFPDRVYDPRSYDFRLLISHDSVSDDVLLSQMRSMIDRILDDPSFIREDIRFFKSF